MNLYATESSFVYIFCVFVFYYMIVNENYDGHAYLVSCENICASFTSGLSLMVGREQLNSFVDEKSWLWPWNLDPMKRIIFRTVIDLRAELKNWKKKKKRKSLNRISSSPLTIILPQHVNIATPNTISNFGQ